MSVAYTREGEGPPLLLVHGIGMSGAAWTEVSAALRDRFDVISVDLPGFGGSDPLDVAPTVPALSAAMAALMRDQLGLESWSVAGNSLGGGIAIDLALRGLVEEAWAFSPVGFVGQGWERLYLHASIAFLQAAAPLLRRAVPPAPSIVRRGALIQYAWHGDRRGRVRSAADVADVERASAMRATRRAAFRWTPAPITGSLPVPLTIAWGAHDLLLLTQPQSARARAKLPTATHLSLPDAGHLPGWDDPAAVARVIAGDT